MLSILLIVLINRESTANGDIKDIQDRNERKLPKGKKLIGCSQKYALNGSAIMPEEIIQKKKKTDNISRTADSDIQKERRDNTESYDKVI